MKVCNRVRVILVDDENDFASSFKKLIAPDKRLKFVCHASDRVSGVESACKLMPDIVVMDLNLSGFPARVLDGIEAAKEIRIRTGIKVLFLTNLGEESENIVLQASKTAFASGYIFKSQFKNIADTLFNTVTSNTPQKTMIKALIRDGNNLTDAEKAVFSGLLEGDVHKYSRAEIKTIENQKTKVYKKLGINGGKKGEVLKELFENM